MDGDQRGDAQVAAALDRLRPWSRQWDGDGPAIDVEVLATALFAKDARIAELEAERDAALRFRASLAEPEGALINMAAEAIWDCKFLLDAEECEEAAYAALTAVAGEQTPARAALAAVQEPEE